MSQTEQDLDYRPAQRRRGRRVLLSFEVINALSYSLLAGNLLTLLLLRLGANTTLIGLLSALPFVSFLFMPFSKNLVPRLGLVRIFGLSWTARYVVVIPIIFAPLFVVWGNPGGGVALIMIAYLMFQIMRGFGLVSISPLYNEVSAGKDRGDYLSKKAIWSNAATIVGGVIISILLGQEAPLGRYSLFIGIGILLGFWACWLIFRVPEPPGARFGARSSFFEDLRKGLKDKVFARFIVAYACYMFITSVGRPFLLVYTKQVYQWGDDAAMILTVVGTAGAIAMGRLSQTVLDRLGAKPMYVIFMAAFVLSNIPLSFLPALPGVGAWIFLCVIFFMNNLGGSGGDSTSQVYFYGITKDELQFNLGMVYYLVTGIMGAIGSFAGGLALNLLQGSSPGAGADLGAFRIFFIVVSVLSAGVVVLLLRLSPQGGRSVVDAMWTILSPRDMRNMNTLRRLDQSSSIGEERRMLMRIEASDSDLVVDGMLKRLSSPIYSIRNQALLTLERLPAGRRVQDALIAHVRDHQFGSAYRAARILGEKGVQKAVPSLREALDSEDYLLQAYAASALGLLGDTGSIRSIEGLLSRTDNYLVMVNCIGSLNGLASPGSIPAILAVLSRKEVPPFMRDEVVFGVAGILEMDTWLYGRYLAFLEDKGTGIAMLSDDLDACPDEGIPGAKMDRTCVQKLLDLTLIEGDESLNGDEPAIDAYPDSLIRFSAVANTMLNRFMTRGIIRHGLAEDLRETLSGHHVTRFVRYRFFIAGLAIYALTVRAPLVKEGSAQALGQAPKRVRSIER